jgi:hypothetical protein
VTIICRAYPLLVHSFHTRFHVLAGLAGVRSNVSVKYVVPSATFFMEIVMESAFVPKMPIAFVTPAGTAIVKVTGLIGAVAVADRKTFETLPSSRLVAGYKAFSLDATTDVATLPTALDLEYINFIIALL